jgi:hypothetical protein
MTSGWLYSYSMAQFIVVWKMTTSARYTFWFVSQNCQNPCFGCWDKWLHKCSKCVDHCSQGNPHHPAAGFPRTSFPKEKDLCLVFSWSHIKCLPWGLL